MGGAVTLDPRPPWAGRERAGRARAGAPWPYPRIRNTHGAAGASQGSERGKLPAPAGNPEQAAGPSPTRASKPPGMSPRRPVQPGPLSAGRRDLDAGTGGRAGGRRVPGRSGGLGVGRTRARAGFFGLPQLPRVPQAPQDSPPEFSWFPRASQDLARTSLNTSAEGSLG